MDASDMQTKDSICFVEQMREFFWKSDSQRLSSVGSLLAKSGMKTSDSFVIRRVGLCSTILSHPSLKNTAIFGLKHSVS